MTSLEQARNEALRAFAAAGLKVDDLVADGKRHRCPVEGGNLGSVDGCYSNLT